MTTTPYTLKSSALLALRRRYAEQRGQVLGIEVRLADYFDGLVTVEPNADADPQDPQPAHNIYELLGGLKFGTMEALTQRGSKVRASQRDTNHPLHRPCDNRWRAWLTLPGRKLGVNTQTYNDCRIPYECTLQLQIKFHK